MATKATKLPSGNWRSVANLGKGPDGKPRRKSFTAPTRKEAERLAAEAEHDFERVKGTPDLFMTLGEAWDRFIAMKTPIYSPVTISNHITTKTVTPESLLSTRICDITRLMLQDYVGRLVSENYSPVSIRTKLTMIITVIRTFRPDFIAALKYPGCDKEMAIPDSETVRRMIQEADNMGNKDLALAIVLASQLGLRRGEICALTFADVVDDKIRINKSRVVTRDGGWITKSTKTTKSKRTLAQTQEIKDRLKEFSGNPSDNIFDVSPHSITGRFHFVCSKVSPQLYRFHDLRHYNASVMISMNVPLFYVARRLGHANVNMVSKVYGHLMEGKTTEVDTLVENYFK